MKSSSFPTYTRTYGLNTVYLLYNPYKDILKYTESQIGLTNKSLHLIFVHTQNIKTVS